MNTESLNLERRTAGARHALHETHTKIREILQEQADFVENSADIFEGAPLPKHMKDDLVGKDVAERLALANKHVSQLQTLWVERVAEVRSHWGNDAVDTVLHELSRR